jgi:hypothetical protein
VEAVGRDDRDVDGVDDLGEQDGGGDLSRVAAAFRALDEDGVRAPRRDLLGVVAGADGGDDDDTGILEAEDQLAGRREGEGGDPYALVDDDLYALGRIGCVGAQIAPKGASVRALISRTAERSRSGDIVAEARMPSAPAFAVADTRRGPATHPMPVWTSGW